MFVFLMIIMGVLFFGYVVMLVVKVVVFCKCDLLFLMSGDNKSYLMSFSMFLILVSLLISVLVIWLYNSEYNNLMFSNKYFM